MYHNKHGKQTFCERNYSSSLSSSERSTTPPVVADDTKRGSGTALVTGSGTTNADDSAAARTRAALVTGSGTTDADDSAAARTRAACKAAFDLAAAIFASVTKSGSGVDSNLTSAVIDLTASGRSNSAASTSMTSWTSCTVLVVRDLVEICFVGKRCRGARLTGG